MKTSTLQYTYSMEELTQNAQTIMFYLCGNVQANANMLRMTERNRQFFTWGASNFGFIESTDGCYGLQFSTNGLKHKGIVRVWYNPASDLYDLELLTYDGKTCVYEEEDLEYEQIHNTCHEHIEREDDVKV